MRLRRKLLQNSRLYLILDAEVNTHDQLFEIAALAVQGGVHLMQLRDKSSAAKDILKLSKRILKLTRESNALFIINDRVDLTLEAGADGVHLGQDDVSVRTARKILGKDFLIGKSCQNLPALKKAQQEGADYVGFGSFYRTKTKPKRQPLNIPHSAKIIAGASVPVFAIGGITLQRCSDLLKEGVARFAVCREICEPFDHKIVRMKIKAFVNLLNSRG